MLTVVSGAQRSGKTLYVVRRVIRHHDEHRPAAPIWSNIDIDHPAAVRLAWSEILDPDLPPGYVIWDEAPRAWDSRKSMSASISMLQGITEEGKSLRDVYLTAQDFGMVDSRIRRMCSRAVRITGRFFTKDVHDPETDELLTRRHPRLVTVETGSWMFADKGPGVKRANVKSRIHLPWRFFAPYVGRYDTAEKVAVADHLATKDFYRDAEGSDARGKRRSFSGAPLAGAAPRPRAAGPVVSLNGGRHAR